MGEMLDAINEVADLVGVARADYTTQWEPHLMWLLAATSKTIRALKANRDQEVWEALQPPKNVKRRVFNLDE